MIIYKITNKINGKCYVGQTIQKLEDRWSDHSRPCLGKHPNKSVIGTAIRKYGKENFTIEQIDQAMTLETLNVLEQHYISKFNTLAPNGYNVEPGGERVICSEETKAKISAALKGRPIKNRMNGAPKGRPVSEERRARISKTMTGVPQPWKYKKILVVETGIVYESVNEAARLTGLGRTTISQLLKSGKIHKGLQLTFKYFDGSIVNERNKNENKN